jgi:hypothetical protein
LGTVTLLVGSIGKEAANAMIRHPKAGHKSVTRLDDVSWLSKAARRRTTARLLTLDKARVQEHAALARQLETLRSEYHQSISALAKPGGWRRFRALQKELAGAPRSRRLREADRLLAELGIDCTRLAWPQAAYVAATRELLASADIVIRHRPPLFEPEFSPWVTYTAPYNGWRWSYSWDRSGQPSDPVMAGYSDSATGRIGSTIRTHLEDAGDDDHLNAQYYTGLNVWHTALAAGPLEGYLAFEMRASTYSGSVRDEFGISDATFNQWARARLQVVDPQGTTDTQESRIFNVIGTDWGDGRSWDDYVASPGDLHWYYFKTAANFGQGSALLVEAGIWNVTWFLANDESIDTVDDIDLRLDRIMVRSCPA